MVLLAIHGRFFVVFFFFFFFFFLIFSLPLLIISPSLWLKHVHPGFINCYQVRNNPTITAFVCFQKFPDTFKALCLLLHSEQMRYPSSANHSQVQTLFQNCTLPSDMPVQLSIFLTDNRASCSTTIFTAAILALVTEVLGLPGRVSSSTENFPALKALIYLKTVRIEMV